jgi:mono/diheme cytochrome c family protein
MGALALIAASLGAGCAGGSTGPTRSGAAVFASSCAACHTLAPEGRSVPAPPGGSLLDYRMSAAVVASFARQMPLPRPLSAAELRAVAAYVADAQRRHARSR